MMSVLATLWRGGVGLRNWAFARGWLAQRRLPVPVISVGSLEVGGSGKTPITGWLLSFLQAQGLRPGLLTRGYGRRVRTLQLWLPSTAGATPQPSWQALAERLGDEPAMLLLQGLQIPMAVYPNRYAAGLALLEASQPPCDCLVLDDGFAHRQLQRQVNIVVMRAELSPGQARCLPQGRLREGLAALQRATLLWWHHKTPWTEATLPPTWLQRYLPAALPVVQSRLQVVGLRGGHAYDVPVMAVAAVAQPQGFFAALQRQGFTVLRSHAFADHHRFTQVQINRLYAAMRACQARACVVTEKDYVKLVDRWPDATTLWALRCEVALHTPVSSLWQHVQQRCGF